MKSLLELAREWDENLVVIYNASLNRWECTFILAFSPCEQDTCAGLGATQEEAMSDYTKKIRGKPLCFISREENIIRQVPEILRS